MEVRLSAMISKKNLTISEQQWLQNHLDIVEDIANFFAQVRHDFNEDKILTLQLEGD